MTTTPAPSFAARPRLLAAIAAVLCWPISVYRRWLSPLLPRACRFEPSCSHYAILALHTHTPVRALGLIGWRIARCQPFCEGGTDYPPPGRYGDARRLIPTDTSRSLPSVGSAVGS